MYDKSRAYPQPEPVQYSPGFGKEKIPRKTWLQEEQAAPTRRYRDPYGMPMVRDDPEQEQRYKDYTKRRGGKDPMGFSDEERKRRSGSGDTQLVRQNDWRTEDHFAPKKEVNPVLDNQGYDPTKTPKPPSDEWNSVNRPGYSPQYERAPRFGTRDLDPALAKDGRKFATKMERDAYDTWSSGGYGDSQRGVEAGSDKLFQDRRGGQGDAYNAYPTGYKDPRDAGDWGQAAKKAPPPPPPPKWLEDKNPQAQPTSYQRQSRPGDASGRMPSYPGNRLGPIDEKVYDGEVKVNKPIPKSQSAPAARGMGAEYTGPGSPGVETANYYPGSDDPLYNNGLPVMRKRPDPTTQRTGPQAPKESRQAPTWSERGMDQLDGPEGSPDAYWAQRMRLENSRGSAEYQRNYKRLKAMKRPSASEMVDARDRYKPPQSGSYGDGPDGLWFLPNG